MKSSLGFVFFGPALTSFSEIALEFDYFMISDDRFSDNWALGRVYDHVMWDSVFLMELGNARNTDILLGSGLKNPLL